MSIAQAGLNFVDEDLPDGWEYSMVFDDIAGKLRLDVKIPENTYFAISYGTGMTGIDMVSFHGRGNGDVQDLYSSFYGEPDVDDQQDYDCTSDKSGGWYTFECYRDLQTTDPNEDDF